MNTMTADELLVAPRQQLIDTIVAQKHQIEQMESRIQELEFRIEMFDRQIFGRKSERFIPDPLQMTLDFEIPHTPLKIEKQTVAAHTRIKATPQKGHGRGERPTHLPIKEITIEPTEDVSGMVRIGQEETWEYDCKKDSIFIRLYIRPKYAPKDGSGTVVVAELPSRPVEKGNMGPGIMSNIAVDKYVYHTPLDRQRRKFKQQYTVDFSESHLCDIIKQVGFWYEPVYELMIEDLLAVTYLQADETMIKVLWHELKGRAHTGWYWGYYAPVEKILVFDFQMSRGQEGPTRFLEKFKGIIQCDDYGGYNRLRARSDIIRMACMAHVRRKFTDALTYDIKRCTQVLEIMKPWFVAEAQAKKENLGFNDRLIMRREQIEPSMHQCEDWLRQQLPSILPQSPFGKAVGYALNQWPDFAPFLNDGRVELTTNLDENNMRPVAVGRKNYMFKGSPEAARRGAIIYSVLGTAMKHGLDPWQYSTDLLTWLPRVKNNQLRDFLPYNWINLRKKYVGE
jgi:transposase